MPRPLPHPQRSVLLRLLRGQVDAAGAAAELGLSPRSLSALKRRYLRSKLPTTDGTLTAPVSAPAHIRRDTWGVAHIEAASLSDAYAALGCAMAQDRLWQLDHMRRLAHGQLAEILGASHLRQDRLHRTIGLTASARAAADAMPEEVRQVLDAMAAGINAVMDASADNLPLEFELLGYQPTPWNPVDSIAIWKWRWWMLTGRLDVLAQREAVKRYLPPDLIDIFLAVEAGEETIVPSTQPAGIGGFDTGEGSNNWVVGGSRTQSGSPILATDPHNGIDLSRQWYQAQITCQDGDIDAIGAFFLGTPGIYMGATRHTAWGVTNHTASARDLYIEEAAADFATTTETIAVRGAADDILEIRRTERGPVVTDFVARVDDDEAPVLSMRWVGAEATTGFESMLALIRSRSLDDVQAALRQWPFPILNFLYADNTQGGRIGYHAVGRVPDRRRSTYGFKRANEPLDQWDGMVAFDDMPHAIDPHRGWLASANNPPWARQDPYMRSGNWADGYRARQVRSRIEAVSQHTIDSVAAIHADVVLGRAQDLAPVLARIALAGPSRAIRALGEILQDWDGAFTVDSAAPTVFTAFWEQWLHRVALVRFPPRAARLVAGKAGAVAARILRNDDPGWYPGGTDLNKQVLAALADTDAWLRTHVGTRRTQWRWGRLHTVHFRHPVTDAVTGANTIASAELAKLLDIGPFETSGGTGTIRAAGVSTARPFVVTGLSTYRLVVDLAQPARALATSTGGQSGHVADPNYRRQSELWVRDEYHPLLMDRSDVDANLSGALRLTPST